MLTIVFMILVCILIGCGKGNIRKEVYEQSAENYNYLCKYISTLNPELKTCNYNTTLELSNIMSDYDNNKISNFYTDINKKYKDLNDEEKKLIDSLMNLEVKTIQYSYKISKFNRDVLLHQANMIKSGCDIETEVDIKDKYSNEFKEILESMQKQIDEISNVTDEKKCNYPSTILKDLDEKIISVFREGGGN
ncbi:hypothetical protein [Clostridium botulinum]|nr:hypothetical protein [Clostridium botulinum]MCD3196327.1 hypothetical protein [Clostridium botulinum C/D]MCD3209851.1 hypothetical protein [Clostridium botulinum C/D]MCD3212905.1 hypothetical protein [Clostridium botulinum C/D]MCD3226709.1 hypothetical protein [Clostridium botulinum C/D]MCD3235640.1 hypothetical protein [Clostridium botulinum C/D]